MKKEFASKDLSEPIRAFNTANVLTFCGSLLAGTITSISLKLAYQTKCYGLDTEQKYFAKPLFSTMIMFVAMALGVPLHFCIKAAQQRQRTVTQSLLVEEEAAEEFDHKFLMFLAVPAVFDLSATACGKIGLLHVNVSTYQLIKCMVIVTTALMKRFVMKQRLLLQMWVGITMNTIAVVFVSMATLLSEESQQKSSLANPVFGILVLLLDCMFRSCQWIIEEKLMALDAVPPLLVVGMEGVWGTLILWLLVFPLAYILPGNDFGECLENLPDTLKMVQNSGKVQIFLLLFFISVTGLNLGAIFVTNRLSSVWRAMLDTFRPFTVWVSSVGIFYLIAKSKAYGEELNKWSWLQFIGLVLLFLGSTIYNGTIRLCWTSENLSQCSSNISRKSYQKIDEQR